MKAQSNSMLVAKLHKQIADIQLNLETKQAAYDAGLKMDKPFAEVKGLFVEIKSLKKQLKQLQAQAFISERLAEYSI